MGPLEAASAARLAAVDLDRVGTGVARCWGSQRIPVCACFAAMPLPEPGSLECARCSHSGPRCRAGRALVRDASRHHAEFLRRGRRRRLTSSPKPRGRRPGARSAAAPGSRRSPPCRHPRVVGRRLRATGSELLRTASALAEGLGFHPEALVRPHVDARRVRKATPAARARSAWGIAAAGSVVADSSCSRSELTRRGGGVLHIIGRASRSPWH